jgi:hypothetical protein
MYVAPTPFALAEGTAHRRTLILPADHPVDNDLVEMATLTRREVESMAVAYNFDLRTNELQTSLVPNPNAGREHVFKAYRLTGDSTEMVALRERSREIAELTFQLDNNEAGEE